MQKVVKGLFVLLVLLGIHCFGVTTAHSQTNIGVIFVVHGGFDTYADQYMWDSGIQQFTYDPKHSVYQLVIWNPALWSMVMTVESSVKFKRKYEFEYPLIGGTDPFGHLTLQQLADMETELDNNTHGINFEVDWAAWMCGDCIEHYPYPRFVYYGPDGPGVGYDMTYCGQNEPGGAWPGCDPHRYNVDGPVERLLQKGISRIIVIDWTMGGPRFSKTYDVVQMLKRAIDDWNTAHSTSIPYPLWVNDYSNLMERSYPTAPVGWTKSMGLPTADSHVLLKSGPNPVVSDTDVATLQREAIEAGMSGTVSDAQTGVIILNHAINDHNEFFDPKMDDTILLNENIKAQLLTLHPTMDPDNIIGARMGIKELNPENGKIERTRPMRGEELGHQWLYESAKKPPADEWGYLYWDGLEYLKSRGVQHIVIGFTQIATHSVLDLVEIPNQVGKEIGIKTWAKWSTGDFVRYPVVGHPFDDYWGNWVDTDCGGVPCCFIMGGCGDPLRPYPPPRQTPLNQARGDMDPSLAYDLSDYGHLGYDPNAGAPDPDNPVQNQYTGTWAMYVPPNDDPRVGELLAKHVINAAVNPLPYLTNGELCSINGGENVTWESHVVSGSPSYTYAWSIKEAGDPAWTPVGGNSASWAWSPGSGDEGVYSVRCSVTDSLTNTGEVIWEEFAVGDGDDDCIQNAEDNCPSEQNQDQLNSDQDTLGDVCDNCPMLANPGQEDADSDDVGNLCDNCSSVANPLQEDAYPPGGNSCGDACECEGNFDGNTTVDGMDAATFKSDYGRSSINRPCTNTVPCNGDFSCNGNVDGLDAALFKSDFGRSGINKPCPACATDPWCVYP